MIQPGPYNILMLSLSLSVLSGAAAICWRIAARRSGVDCEKSIPGNARPAQTTVLRLGNRWGFGTFLKCSHNPAHCAEIVILSSFSNVTVGPLGVSMNNKLATCLRQIVMVSYALAITTGIQAQSLKPFTIFATGSAVNATAPDSIAVVRGSAWVRRTKGADSPRLPPARG